MCVCVLWVSVTFLIFFHVRHDAVKTTTTTIIVITVQARNIVTEGFIALFLFRSILYLFVSHTPRSSYYSNKHENVRPAHVRQSHISDSYASINARAIKHAVRRRQCYNTNVDSPSWYWINFSRAAHCCFLHWFLRCTYTINHSVSYVLSCSGVFVVITVITFAREWLNRSRFLYF